MRGDHCLITVLTIVVGFILVVFLIALAKTLIEIFTARISDMDIVALPFNSEGVEKETLSGRTGDGNYTWKMETRMLQLINIERRKHWLESTFAKPLVWDEDVARVAKKHAIDQLLNNFIGHKSSNGDDLTTRLLKDHVNFEICGENVARGYRTVEEVISALMDEPMLRQNHRKNILNSNFMSVGISILQDPYNGLICVQDFIA